MSCAGSSTLALAEPGPERSESAIVLELFDALDTSRDGAVDRSEIVNVVQLYVEGRVRARFAQLDRNRDGRVTKEEVGKMDAKRFARFDLNGDGAFTLPELSRVMRRKCEARIERVLVALDTDGDGRWTQRELREPAYPEDRRLAVRIAESAER